MAYGMGFFTKGSYESAAKNKNWEDLGEVDLSGKSFLVTGGNSGLGYSACEFFASHGGVVHMICRSKERGEAAVKEIQQKSGNQNVHLHLCDISLPDEIRQTAKNFQEAGYTLDVLVNSLQNILINIQRYLTLESCWRKGKKLQME